MHGHKPARDTPLPAITAARNVGSCFVSSCVVLASLASMDGAWELRVEGGLDWTYLYWTLTKTKPC